jgi:hypothetical protein
MVFKDDMYGTLHQSVGSITGRHSIQLRLHITTEDYAILINHEYYLLSYVYEITIEKDYF